MKNEIKTSIEGLEIGMFVSRLDRPWIKTSFALEGMQITSSEDISRLKKYCNYVYVDVEQGAAPHPKFWVLSEKGKDDRKLFSRPSGKSNGTDEFIRLRKKTYEEKTAFSAESETARRVHEKLGSDFQSILSDLRQGRDLDLHAVEAGITDMVESIIRNPSAMTWVAHIRRLDEYTYSRALGTSVWCATFGRHLGLEKLTIDLLALGGLLLDLGKSRLSSELLNLSRELAPEEKEQMEKHVDYGVQILAKASKESISRKLPITVLQMIATHHERADASGYPQGLENDEIPLFGRIAGVADSFDAMTSDRPYMSDGPMPPHAAINELYELRGSKFQSELVEQFIQTVGLYPTGSLVELNTGEVGAVIAVNGLRRLRPSITLLLDENKEPLSPFRHIDLSTMGSDISVAHGLPSGAFGIDMGELFL